MITFITGNQDKIKEAKRMLGDDVDMLSVDLVEIQSLDVKQVILAKLVEARKHVPVGGILVDDSGYYFEALGKLPGVFSKFFLKELGCLGIVDMVHRLSSKRVKGYTCIGYMDEEDNVQYFLSEYEGQIVDQRGTNGFGYDSIFMPDGSDVTVAEMDEQSYSLIKPRSKALLQLKEYLQSVTK